MSNDIDDRVSGSRGPAYPYIDLAKAVEKATVIADKGAARQTMPPEAFYKLWGMGAKSSASRQTMAALNYYDLVEYVGRGKDRKVKLTDLALRITLDKRPDSNERSDAIKQAAVQPSIFRELHEKYAPFFPDDVVIETYLKIDKQFSEEAARTAIRHFRTSMEFAGLDKPSVEPKDSQSDMDGTDESADAETGNLPEIGIGDIVQATVNGSDQFADGAKVIGISDDGKWVFLDQSDSGVSIDQVSVLRKGTTTLDLPPPVPAHILQAVQRTPSPVEEGYRRAMFPLDEGDVTLHFPEHLSRDSLEDLRGYLDVFFKKEIRKTGE